MRILIEADGLAEARAKDGGDGKVVGSQARVTGLVLKGVLQHTPQEWGLTVASGKPLQFDTNEEKAKGNRPVGHVWMPRPPLLPFGNSFTIVPARKALEKWFYPAAIKSCKADLIHYTQRYPMGAAPLARVEVWTAMDLYPLMGEGGEAVETTNLHLLRRRMRGVHVMAISKTTAADVHRILEVPESNISLNYLGIDRAVFTPTVQADEAEIVLRYDLPERFLFYSGALFNRKNVITLLRSLELLHQSAPRLAIPLVTAGGKGWPTMAESAAFTEISGRLRSVGLYRDLGRMTDEEMAVAHRRCTAYVHPSTFEGFGMTILEAMSCGAPVVCGRNSAICEVAGNAARYVEDVLDVGELTEALRDQLSASEPERTRCKEKSLAQAAKFSLETFNEGVGKLTVSLLTRDA